MKTHKISIEVDAKTFKFHQSIFPWGERTTLFHRLLTDLQSIHATNPSLLRAYVQGKINILQFKDFLENESKN